MGNNSKLKPFPKFLFLLGIITSKLSKVEERLVQLEKSILKKLDEKLDGWSFTRDTPTSDTQSKKEISDIQKENKALSAEITLLQREIASKDRDFKKVSNEKDKLRKEVLELNDIVLNLKGQL